MEIYIWCSILTFIIAYFIKRNPDINYPGYSGKRKYTIKMGKTGERFLKIMCLLPLTLVSAFRYGVGTDYFQTYYYGFQRFIEGNNYDNFEVGYKGFMFLIAQISTNPQIVFITTSIVFSIFIFWAIYDNSNDILLSIFLLIATRYFFISMNVVRQFMGMAIILYAFKYIFEKKYIKYLLFSFIAASIHYSLILCVLFLFADLIKINLNRLIVIICSVVGLVALAGNAEIYNIVYRVLKSSKYVRHFLNEGLYAGTTFAVVTFLINVSILIIFWLNHKAHDKDKKYQLYFNIQLITVLLCTIMTVLPLVERIYYIFSFVQILSIPYMLGLYKSRLLRISLKASIMVVYGVYCYLDIFIRLDHQVVPYMSIFSER